MERDDVQIMVRACRSIVHVKLDCALAIVGVVQSKAQLEEVRDVKPLMQHTSSLASTFGLDMEHVIADTARWKTLRFKLALALSELAFSAISTIRMCLSCTTE